MSEIPSEPIRLTIYLALAGLLSACMSAIWLARNKPVHWRTIPHVRLALATLGRLIVWLTLLAFSIRDFHWLTRTMLIWPMAALSGGATILGWTWFVLTVKCTFKIVHRKHANGNGVA